MKIVGLWLTALLTVWKWDGTYGQEVRSLTLPLSSNSQAEESLELCERINLHCPFDEELPSWQFTPFVSDIPIYTLHGENIEKHSVAQIINDTVLQIVADPAVLYSVSLFECGYKNAHRRISLSIQGNCAANSVNNWSNGNSTFSLNDITKLPIALNSEVGITCNQSSRLETATTVWQLFTRDCTIMQGDDCLVWNSSKTQELDNNLLSLSNDRLTLTLRGISFFNKARLVCIRKNATHGIRSSLVEIVIQGNESKCCPPQTNSISTAATRLLTTILPTISLPGTSRGKTPVPFSVPTKATIAPTLLSYSFSKISTSKRENPVSTAAVSWTPSLMTTSALLSTSKLPMTTISTATSLLRTRTSPLAVTTTLSVTPTRVIVIPSSAYTLSATFTPVATATERTTSLPNTSSAKDPHTDGWIYAVIVVFCVLFLLGIIVLIAVVVRLKRKRKGKLEITRVVRLSLPPDPAVTNMFSLVSEMSSLPPTSNENGRSEATRAEASAKGESVQNKETTKEDTPPPWNPPRPHYNVVRTTSAKSSVSIKAEGKSLTGSETKPTTYHPVLVSLASKSQFELDPAFQPKVDSKTDEEERNPVVLETDDEDTTQPVPSAVLDELDKITEAFMQTASDLDAQSDEPKYAKVIKVKPNTSSTEGENEYDTLNPIQPTPRIDYEIAEEWL